MPFNFGETFLNQMNIGQAQAVNKQELELRALEVQENILTQQVNREAMRAKMELDQLAHDFNVSSFEETMGLERDRFDLEEKSSDRDYELRKTIHKADEEYREQVLSLERQLTEHQIEKGELEMRLLEAKDEREKDLIGKELERLSILIETETLQLEGYKQRAAEFSEIKNLALEAFDTDNVMRQESMLSLLQEKYGGRSGNPFKNLANRVRMTKDLWDSGNRMEAIRMGATALPGSVPVVGARYDLPFAFINSDRRSLMSPEQRDSHDANMALQRAMVGANATNFAGTSFIENPYRTPIVGQGSNYFSATGVTPFNPYNFYPQEF